MAAEEKTNDAADLDVTNVATSVPSASASCTVVPAGSVEPKVSCTPDCVELVPGVTAMPALPAAARFRR